METNQVKDESIEINLQELLYVLLRKAWLIILVALICGVGAGVFTEFFITPVYESTSTIYVLSKTTTITSIADLQVGSQLTDDFMVLIKSRPIVETVINNLELNDISYDEMCSKITLTNPENSRIINITASDPDPEVAKDIADEFAEVTNSQTALIMQADQSSIVQKGVVAQYASSPSLKKNCLIAALIGLLLTCVIIVLIYKLDDRIKNTDDIEKYLQLNTLGSIPIEGDPKEAKKKKK